MSCIEVRNILRKHHNDNNYDCFVFYLDLKPANIFLTVQGAIKLGDLGLSRFFGNSTKFSFSLVGTPVCIFLCFGMFGEEFNSFFYLKFKYYMSPERIRELGYDFQSDIWSLGCILYEVILILQKNNLFCFLTNNKIKFYL